jgi:hypothetical protein
MTDRHEHLDEGTIHAWLDGALPPDESALVESAAESCAECAARVAEARGLIAASSRILSSLDAVPAGVIPGSSADVDQLAALRARRQAASRRWWQDRRLVVAASLVFVAGVSSLVWRSSGNESASTDALTVETAAAPAPPAPAPSAAAADQARPGAGLAREAPARDAKVAASPPLPPSTATVRERTTAAVGVDSAAALKVAPTSAPVVGVAANEARSRDTGSVGRVAVDSIAPLRREVAEQQLRQQGAARQAVQQFRADSLRQASAPRAALGAGLRLDQVVVTGVGASMADSAAPGPCYRLRGLTAPTVADTIRLLNLTAPVRSDPSWFRTQLYGALRDTTLAWRSIDSVTVEVRAGFGSDTAAVRFRTDGAAPDLRSAPGVRPVFAARVSCPQ